MSEYKKLTNNNLEDYDPEYDFCVDCRYFGEPNGCNRPNGTCDSYDRFMEIYNRLAELEDKIENGTLIELPCKVGDKVYHLSCKTISEEIVSQIKYTIYNGEIDLSNSHIMTDDLYDKDYNFYRISKLGKSLFLTKVEAEAKLKELQQKS